MFSIVKISEWRGSAMDDLVADGTQDGFRFLIRLKQDWLSGANRFSGEGEALFGSFEADRLIAIGGINRQTADCGRLRRVYVMKGHRRKGLGSKLVRHLLDFASQHFPRVVLRTDSAAADRFYLALGFVRLTAEAGSTHAFEFCKFPKALSEDISVARLAAAARPNLKTTPSVDEKFVSRRQPPGQT